MLFKFIFLLNTVLGFVKYRKINLERKFYILWRNCIYLVKYPKKDMKLEF